MATATASRRAAGGRDSMSARGGAVAGRAAEAWGAFSLPQKIITAMVAVGLIAGAVLVSRYVSQPAMTPLFSNLSGEDASAIVDKLQSSGVEYELTDGGATILVPRDQVYDQRIAMSAEGLPQSSQSGYSLLDEQGVTTSQFQQQVAYQRALEGELAKTIEAIGGVDAAVVHLAIPEKDVFLDETKAPTASVLVSTAPGQALTNDQVLSIVNLTSSSVEGLLPDAVTVVDGDGTLLSAPGMDTGGGGSAMDAQGEFEAAMTTDLQALLDKVVGPGNAVAAVTADLDFDQNEATTERFLPPEQGTPALQEDTVTEGYTGTGGVPGGILGPDNNGVPIGGDGDSTYNRETRTATNAVGKVTEKTVSAPGAVRRLSVSVIVDTQKAGDVDLAALQTSVAAAAGIDAARGDILSVTRIPFDATAADAAQAELEAAKGEEAAAQRMNLIRTGVLAFLVILLVAITLIASRRRKPKVDVLDITTLDDGEERLAALDAAIDNAQMQSSLRDAESLAITQRSEEVAELVERQPDEVAELLRTWLADRRP